MIPLLARGPAGPAPLLCREMRLRGFQDRPTAMASRWQQFIGIAEPPSKLQKDGSPVAGRLSELSCKRLTCPPKYLIGCLSAYILTLFDGALCLKQELSDFSITCIQ